MVQVDLLHRAAAVICAVVNAQHLQILIQQSNGRKDPVTMHAAGIQVIGPEVRRGDKTHTVFKQRCQQSMQDECISDFRHMKLVKAN